VVGRRESGQVEGTIVSRRPGEVTRRGTLALGAGAATMLVMRPALGQSETQAEVERHGMSGFGDLKYPADFKQFDYVNPNAPKGGLFSQIGSVRQFNQNFNTFNSLNSYIFKGDAALGMEITFATLMVSAFDEPDAMYGLTARAVVISTDGLTYRFLLRPEAKFHDGTKLDAHDVAFSLNLLKSKGHPIITQLMRDVTSAEAVDDLTLVVRFAKGRGRDVPLFVVGLPIFSRAYYSKREFDESTMEAPLGSGPYKVGRLEPGRFIEYDRVKDWWGADLPVSRGMNNFDVLRWEFYRDRDVALEGFKGKNYLFHEEFTSRFWATRYDFAAIKDGRVKREELPDETISGGQGWFFNTRREKFKDPRVREAIIDAFDFEWTNKNIMYGSYQRTHSVFQNSNMMAVGKPGPDELALLEPFRGQVPEEVFGEPFVPPVSDGSGQDRALLRKASALLQQAGYGVRDGKRVTPKGERFTIEFLLDDPGFQPHHLALIKNLTILGIDASARVVDHAQYKLREDTREFDMGIQRISMSNIPGDSLRNYFTSQAAAINGSYNLAGIADPVIDALVDKIIAAETRPALIAACKALDRVFRAGRYWVPQWNKASHWIAYWDVFGRPPKQPRYARAIPDTWWYDPDRATKTQREL
jgi:microcin C transport system substrate-binding protein